MIASEQVKVLWVLYLICQEQTNGLYTLFAAINIVSNEEKLLVAHWKTCDVEQPKEVKVLAVDITEDFDGSLQIK